MNQEELKQLVRIAEAVGWKVYGQRDGEIHGGFPLLGCSPETRATYVPDLNMGPRIDEVPDLRPICPLCKTAMRAFTFDGCRTTFDGWRCTCVSLPGTETILDCP